MSIQFACVACAKHIEIDDQWAMRLVECPYCHDTVRAPGMSTMRAEEPPLASPVGPGSYPGYMPAVAPSAPPAPSAVAPVVPGSRNALAFVSLGLACLAFGLLLGLRTFAYVKLVEPLGVNPAQEQVMKAMEAAANAQEPWVMQLALMFFGFLGVWLAAIVCSIIAVTRRVRRPFAVAALMVASLPILLMLAGI